MFFYLILVSITLIFALFLYQYYLLGKIQSKTSEIFKMEAPHKDIGKKLFAKKGYYLSKKADFPDKTFPNNMAFWGSGDSALDSTWLARSVLLSLSKISDDNGLKAEFIDKCESRTIDFIRAHFDNEEGAFMPNLHSWPCLYGINSVITILKQFSPYNIPFVPLGRNTVEDIIGKDNVSKIVEFVYRCKDDSNDCIGFKETPYDDYSTVVATDTALLILWNLEEYPSELNKIKKYLNSCFKECKLENRSIFGSVNYPLDKRPPCSSITRFAIRSFVAIEAFIEKYEIRDQNQASKKGFDLFLKHFKKDRLDDILELFKACKSEDGSFSAYPNIREGERNRSDIYHTYSVISILSHSKKMLKLLSKDISEIVDLHKLENYIENLKTDDGGYDISKNDYKFSSIFGTRCTLEAMHYLKELFGKQADLWRTDNLINKMENFLGLCFDKDKGAFFAFPVSC